MIHPHRLLVALCLVAPAAAQAPGQLPHQNACGVSHPVVGSPCPAGFITVPSGWYSGDSHEHIQQCFAGSDLLPPQIYADMVAANLNVSNALIWGAGFITPDQFLAYVTTYLSGTEDPASASDPDRILWTGIETSGISAANLGHMIGLNITPSEADVFQLQLGCPPYFPDPGWINDGSGDYSVPILDQFRQAPNAVTGYAHQSWPVNLYDDRVIGGWDWEDMTLPSYVGTDAQCSFGQDFAFPVPKTCGNTHPTLAPFDVAFGRIDFIEAFELLESTCGDPMEKRYFGMFYKLLNSGQKVALSAGTDADCIGLACEPRVYVKLFDGDAFNFDNWTRALAAGRTSLASGPYQFLELEVEDEDPGSTIHLDTSGGMPMVSVKASFWVDITDGGSVTQDIEIIQDGVVVATDSFGPLSTGIHTFEVDVPVTSSGWIAARTADYATHTGAIYTLVDGKPIANCEDAEYWALYADFLNWNLDVAAAVGPAALEFYVGCSETEIRSYIDDGREIYAAVRDYATPEPLGITRLGTPSPAECTTPPVLVTADVPTANQPFTVRYINAPPNSPGGLALATAPAPVPIPLLGAVFHILINPSIDPVPLLSNAAGFGKFTVPSMPSNSGVTVYIQAAWFNPADCAATGLLSSSDAFALTIQP